MVTPCIIEWTGEALTPQDPKSFKELSSFDLSQAIMELHYIGARHFGLTFDKTS